MTQANDCIKIKAQSYLLQSSCWPKINESFTGLWSHQLEFFLYQWQIGYFSCRLMVAVLFWGKFSPSSWCTYVNFIVVFRDRQKCLKSITLGNQSGRQKSTLHLYNIFLCPVFSLKSSPQSLFFVSFQEWNGTEWNGTERNGMEQFIGRGPSEITMSNCLTPSGITTSYSMCLRALSRCLWALTGTGHQPPLCEVSLSVWLPPQ